MKRDWLKSDFAWRETNKLFIGWRMKKFQAVFFLSDGIASTLAGMVDALFSLHSNSMMCGETNDKYYYYRFCVRNVRLSKSKKNIWESRANIIISSDRIFHIRKYGGKKWLSLKPMKSSISYVKVWWTHQLNGVLERKEKKNIVNLIQFHKISIWETIFFIQD